MVSLLSLSIGNFLFNQQVTAGTGKLQRTFEDFLLNQPAQTDLSYLVLSLILSALLAWFLGKLYVRYGIDSFNCNYHLNYNSNKIFSCTIIGVDWGIIHS